MTETKESLNVKTMLLYVYLVSVFLILLLFLFLIINRIADRVVLYKKLYLLNEKYKDAIKQYAEKSVPIYKKQSVDKAKEGFVISEKNYPDMKELFKVYSNALLEL